MRIISKDEKIDLNYDDITLEVINNGAILAHFNSGKNANIGTYNSVGRALEIMEDIQESYYDKCVFFKMPEE